MAEGERFELSGRVNAQRFSRPPHSTALPSLRQGDHSTARACARARGQALLMPGALPPPAAAAAGIDYLPGAGGAHRFRRKAARHHAWPGRGVLRRRRRPRRWRFGIMAQGRGFAPPVFFSNPFFSFSARKKRTVSNCQEKKEDAQNRKCIPCRHRVRRSQLHSVSAGAAKTPYPLAPSSFPNCDRFTGSQFGHLEFYNAARDLDDGGQMDFYGYAL